MKRGCLIAFVKREIVCWLVETPLASFSDHFGPHILKNGFLKSGLSPILSRTLILHGLRPIHFLILLEVLFLIEFVGALIIRTVFSPNKVDLIHGCSQLAINNAFSQPMHNPTSMTSWEQRCSDGDLSLSSHECLNIQCQSLYLFSQFSLRIIFLHLVDASLHNLFIP